MPTAAMETETGWEQRLRNPARKSALRPEYQELKFTLHRKLLDQINLNALAGIENDRIRAEVRQAALTIVEQEPTLLTASEKEQIAEEVLHEVFGLGPLEPLLQDPTISRHPGERLQPGLCRAGRGARTDQRAVSR